MLRTEEAVERVETLIQSLKLPEGVALKMPAADLFESHSIGTSWSPELRAHQVRGDYVIGLKSIAEKLGEHLRQSDVDTYCKAWVKYLGARSGCVSSMITGPAGYPGRRARKASDRADRAYQEIEELEERILKAAKRRRKEAAIDAAGGEAALKRREIEEMKSLQETMRAANRIVRSKPKNEASDEKIEKLVAMGISEANARKLFTSDFAGRYGFPDYELKNNNARIKAAEERLVELERREAAEKSPDLEFEFDGFTVVAAFGEDRLQILHDAIPSKDLRQSLKSAGWKFSRRFECWQRQLTEQAIRSARELLAVDLPSLEEMRSAPPAR